MLYVIIDGQMNLEYYMSTFVAIIVPADGLAPPGSRTSAPTMTTKFVSHLYVSKCQHFYHYL